MIIELTDSATRATCAGVRCDWSLAELSCELSAVATASLINSTLTAADWPGGKPRKSNDNLHLKLNHVLPQFPPFFSFAYLFLFFLRGRKKKNHRTFSRPLFYRLLCSADAVFLILISNSRAHSCSSAIRKKLIFMPTLSLEFKVNISAISFDFTWWPSAISIVSIDLDDTIHLLLRVYL